MSDNQFNVLDMIDEFASASNIDASEIFKKENIKAEEPKSEQPTPPIRRGIDPSLIDDYAPVVYDKKDVIMEESTELKNIVEDKALKDAVETSDELGRKTVNLEAAKKRNGIKHLQIPPGPDQVEFLVAASDKNYERAQNTLDILFAKLKEEHPEAILEYTEEYLQEQELAKAAEPEEAATESAPEPKIELVESDELKIVIDKSHEDELAWDKEEKEKIRKSRSIELKIVEKAPIEFSEIEDADDNLIDKILKPYQHRFNNITAPLPSSRYTASFTGLSYSDTMDLRSQFNNDNLYEKLHFTWTLIFNHLTNQSIGPWQSYKWYIDPRTKRKVRMSMNATPPDNIDPRKVNTVTEFQDFLQKTSFIDMKYMLWKIICASSSNKELVEMTCGSTTKGVRCSKVYDWEFDPASLIDLEAIDQTVLDEMKTTSEMATNDDIMNNYNSSPLNSNNTAKLVSSNLLVVFGHISAYDQLTSVLQKVYQWGTTGLEDNGSLISSEERSLSVELIGTIKGFLVPQEDGSYRRISGIENVIKVIESLDQTDYAIITKIAEMMSLPYVFNYRFKDVTCPACGSVSDTQIEDLTELLFIVAQQLTQEDIQVVLTKA